MSIENLSVQQLRQAADLKEKIAALEKQLAGITGTSDKSAPVAAPKAAQPAKRIISPAHIAKIRAAQKLRWAKVNAAKGKTVAAKVIQAVKTAAKVVAPKPVAKKKGGMSAAGRARIVAAQKARWAKIKAAKPAVKPAVKAVAGLAPKKKGGISAAGRARIAAAAKARWAKVKAAGKKSL